MTQGKLVSISTKTTQASCVLLSLVQLLRLQLIMYNGAQQGLPPELAPAPVTHPGTEKCRLPSRLSNSWLRIHLPEGLPGGEKELQVGTQAGMTP